jgi:hypothetical protein
MRSTRPAIAAAAALLFGLACPGGGGKPASPQSGDEIAKGSDSGSSTSSGDPDTASPGARLVEIVGDIATRVEQAEGCDQFASVLSSWVNGHRAEFEKLVAELKSRSGSVAPDEEAAEMDAKIVEGYLLVVEAAAECGDNEAAMRAYEAFNATVEKATY